MTELCDLGTKYQTDKAPWCWGYTRIYHRWLAERRDVIKTVLEVGVYQGASLRMWRDYFPNAMVYGIEIDDRSQVTDEARIKTYCCDGYLAETYAGPIMQEVGEVDLFVDDARHYTEDQQSLLSIVWPHMREGGVYAVEECRDDGLGPLMATAVTMPGAIRSELIYAGAHYSLLLIQKGTK